MPNPDRRSQRYRPRGAFRAMVGRRMGGSGMARGVGRRSVVGGLASLAAAGSAAAAAARPNILLLLADDWSWQPEDQEDRFALSLPTFERLRRDGVFFANAFSASPSCTASRGALLTGQWPWRLAEGANLASILPRRFPVYPDVLEAA